MSSDELSVLVVAEDAGSAQHVEELLDAADPVPTGPGPTAPPAHAVHYCATLDEAAERVDPLDVDAVLLWRDHREGVERLAASAAVVVVTDRPDERLGAETVARGAQDVLVGDELDSRRLARTLRLAVERWRRERRLHRHADALADRCRRAAHDAREDASLVVARARQLVDHVDHRGEARVREIVRAGGHLLQLSRVAAGVDGVDGTGAPDPVALELGRVIESEVTRARERYDGASIEIVGELPDVRVHADGRLPVIVGSLLADAVVRADPGAPAVVVSVALAGDDRAVVRIGDDGTEIADRGVDAVVPRDRSDRNPDRWPIDRTVDQYGDGTWVEDGDGGGTVVALALPAVG